MLQEANLRQSDLSKQMCKPIKFAMTNVILIIILHNNTVIHYCNENV